MELRKNCELTPSDVMPNSGKKVWWKCSKGHEWQQKIYHRNNGVNCPVCYSERSTSYPEFALLYYLKQTEMEVIHSYKELGYELDIYIPSQETAVEYDGFFWHKNKTKQDLEKNKLCKRNGIKLYRIREGLPSLNDTSIDYVIQKDKRIELEKSIAEIVNQIGGDNVDVDLKRDSLAIESLRNFIEKDSSILSLNPQISKEWNYERNGELKPEYFAPNSGKIVWWRCHKGHEWQSAIQNRNKGSGCPYCTGRNAIKGENDLQTVNPDLAKEWNYKRNNGLSPSDVLPNSEIMAWWICKSGHEWQALIGNRTKGQGCPYCSGKKILKGFNDLQTVNPDLAKEWNYEKNDGLTPDEVTPNSSKLIWWKCEICSFEWRTSVSNRNNQNTGCPKCSKRRTQQALSHQVIQLSLDNKVIAQYSSKLEAEKQTGIGHGQISQVCSGKRNTAGGYIWKYLDRSLY